MSSTIYPYIVLSRTTALNGRTPNWFGNNQVKDARIGDINSVGMEDSLTRAEIIARRREFEIPGYKHKYKTLADVGFDGEWVTPYQIVSSSETGPVLVAHYWLDAPQVNRHRQVLKEHGWLPGIPFNKVLTLALERANLTREDIYVTQAFHLLPYKQWPPFRIRHIDESFDRITRHECAGRTVIALGTVAQRACRRAGVEAIECISPSARLSWEYKTEELAKALKTALVRIG